MASANQLQIPFARLGEEDRQAEAASSPKAIECDDFPYEVISKIAKRESWRKEIYRPIYHVHKWWAQRLGTVFRSLLLGSVLDDPKDLLGAFYSDFDCRGGFTALDPFMGSGTTVGEALKLGMRAVGRDINPVAYRGVLCALGQYREGEVEHAFEALREEVEPFIRGFYSTRIQGSLVDTLYYFWVKTAECPQCDHRIDLFPSRIFAKHAYPKRSPRAQALCPECGEVNSIRYDAQSVTCGSCGERFDPQKGSAKGRWASCDNCGGRFAVLDLLGGDTPPRHRLYAKLALLPDGRKKYLRADGFDLHLLDRASKSLGKKRNWFPEVEIQPGHNTDQARRYGYRFWHQMFNDRQLLCLGKLADGIKKIEEERLRLLFTCLFAGTLEFNNMFASYKGEGTGAVRHMFSHHILKPEKTPLEANPWGTSKSSGAFSTLFKTRILRALEYKKRPFEAVAKNDRANGGPKFFLQSRLDRKRRGESIEDLEEGADFHVSCGDSGRIELEDRSVDAVVTDPPFFDNVHYSELADFFHVWHRHILNDGLETTRRPDSEVQHVDSNTFSLRLGRVLREAHRVLKDEGLLVFSYHHSREEGWMALLSALRQAGFRITAAHPIRSELSVATPKGQAREPIHFDIVVVCRKDELADWREGAARRESVLAAAERQIRRLVAAGHRLSRGDRRVIAMAQLIKDLSALPTDQPSLFSEGAEKVRVWLDDAS